MRQVMKLCSVLLILTMLVVSLTACGGKTEEKDADTDAAIPTEAEKEATATEAPAATATPTPEPPRNLGGAEILVGDWWSTGEIKEPTTQKEEDTLAYREKFQADHNFKLTQVNLGSWGEYQEIFLTSTMAGDPAADIFIMDAGFVPEPMKQGLLLAVNELPSFGNFEAKMWNQSIRETYTQSGKPMASPKRVTLPVWVYSGIRDYLKRLAFHLIYSITCRQAANGPGISSMSWQSS